MSTTNNPPTPIPNNVDDLKDLHPNLVVCPSKAFASLFTKIRDASTPSVEFVQYSKRLMRLLAEDAIAELPQTPITITTPCGPTSGLTYNPNTHGELCAVSIIRAGDSLLEVVRECLPDIAVGKILIQRDESSKTKEAKLYYSKMPPNIKEKRILLCDPMLATGGSSIAALKVLKEEYGVNLENVIFVNVISCPEGLRALAKDYPMVKIVTAWIDPMLNDEKFIVPGLGDYGDRFFNTV